MSSTRYTPSPTELSLRNTAQWMRQSGDYHALDNKRPSSAGSAGSSGYHGSFGYTTIINNNGGYSSGNLGMTLSYPNMCNSITSGIMTNILNG